MEPSKDTSLLKKLPIFRRTSPKAFVWTIVSSIALVAFFIYVASPTGGNIFSNNTLSIHPAEVDANIYLDATLVESLKADGSAVKLKGVDTGEHIITVAQKDYWPWVRKITLTGGDEFTLRPFLIERNMERTLLGKNAEETLEIMPAFKKITSPTSSSTPITSSDLSVSAWIENGSVTVQWNGEEKPLDNFCDKDGECRETYSVPNRAGTVRNIAFYNNRNDVLFIEADNKIYVGDFYGHNLQLFFEGGVGNTPQLYMKDEHVIYVKNQEVLFRFDL